MFLCLNSFTFTETLKWSYFCICSVKRLSVSLDERLHTRLKMYAVLSSVTMNDVVIEALNEYLLKRSKMDPKSAES